MPGSIYENIDVFNEHTEEEVMEVLKMVDLIKVVENLPEKLNT